MNRTVPELLAPAGTPDALEAACAAGADAVYLGGRRFGARSAAGFDDDALEAAIEYAHARDVRVYVTVNTLVTDRELGAAAEGLVRCYESGADAVLVQDAGVAAIARELVPDLPLHASTQMTVHSADGVTGSRRARLHPGRARPRALPRRGRGDRHGPCRRSSSRSSRTVRSVTPGRGSASSRPRSGAGAETGAAAPSPAASPTASFAVSPTNGAGSGTPSPSPSPTPTCSRRATSGPIPRSDALPGPRWPR